MEKNVTTKALARHLGLLKRSSSLLQINKEEKRTEQKFSHLIILDFETTCWKEKICNQKPEIIEFPAVLLNLCSGGIEKKFQQYVQPSENRQLSKFCTGLTGITQDKVDRGISLSRCLKLFDEWIVGIEGEKQVTFHGDAANQQRYIFVTWTDWDLNVCLHHECKRKQIAYPAYLKTWIDLKRTYKVNMFLCQYQQVA